MEDWAAAVGPAGGIGEQGAGTVTDRDICSFSRSKYSVDENMQNRGLLGPHLEPQCLPPPPESPRRVLTSHAGLVSPSGRMATRSCEGGGQARAPHPQPTPAPASLVRALSVCWVGLGSRAGEGTKQCTGQVSEQQQTGRFMQHSWPGRRRRGRAEPAARGWGGEPCPQGAAGTGVGGRASAAFQLPERAFDVHAVAHARDAQLHEVVLGECGQVRALDLVVLEAVAVFA